jgi:hypothetical protein
VKREFAEEEEGAVVVEASMEGEWRLTMDSEKRMAGARNLPSGRLPSRKFSRLCGFRPS